MMLNNNPYQKYRQTQVQTLSQGKLIIMLYDGALKFMYQALDTLEEKNYEKTNCYLIKAQDIISELMITLNMDAGDMAQNLYSLYNFMYASLVQANIKKDKKIINDVIGLMQDLRGAWDAITRSEDMAKASGVDFRG